ncbi:MAG: ATP-binding protein [Bacteroidota bacterium]
MANNFSLTGISDIATGKDLRDQFETEIVRSSLTILNSVSFFLAGVSILFLIAFQINQSVSLTWFFLSIGIAFVLIPFLARQGFVIVSKLLLIAYVDIGIIVLSSVFGGQVMIQAFFIPAMGLSILLFGNNQIRLRNVGIFMSVISYFVLDYVIFEEVAFSSEGFSLIRWAVLMASFVTTWLIFHTFSEFKEEAESQTIQLLEKEKMLNEELKESKEELEHNVDQLKVATEELARSAKTKSDFLATMSHEIRTPMNAILGMTHLLKQDNPRADQLEPINILDFSGNTLLNLIDDILDFSKIEAGKIEFEHIEFELSKLCNIIIESFKVTAANKSITLSLELDPKLPNMMFGDPARLTQVLNNLLSNALKFTEKGTVTLTVKKLSSEEKGHTNIEFAVHDTGIGIAPDRLEKIFESFTQAGEETKRLYGGTGLGLTISKQLTELQGGVVRVDSELGKGTSFYIQLHFEKSGSEQTVETTPPEKSVAQKLVGMRVLLAEDNIVNQKVMQRFLERWQIDPTIVNNGLEAVEAVESNSYDVVLMDLQMPVMDGYDSAANIRKLDDPNKRKIPIIALTAAALKEVREQVYASGMNDYVTKPFNPAELEQKLASYKTR